MKNKVVRHTSHLQISIQSITFGIVGLLIGGVATTFFAANAVNNGDGQIMRLLGMKQHIENMDRHHVEDHIEEAEQTMQLKSMQGVMESMRTSLNGKIGDDFDSAFMTEMIVHHQGAIVMAQQAKKYANHEEIKQLADNIIETQTSEIEQMKLWQHVWGYQTSN